MPDGVSIDLDDARTSLDALIRIPSISGAPASRGAVRASAELTAKLFRSSGATATRIIRAEGGAPAVLASYPAPAGQPTILLYAHHDVQPIGCNDEWDTPAFEPVERAGRLFGRGTADDKAGIAAHLAAIRSHGGRPPVGVTVLIEGEEEIGSPTLKALLAAHHDDLRADVILLADADNLETGTPALTTSLRGMVNCVVEVNVLQHAVHSGSFGGAAPDALTVLCRLLARLHTDEGDVAVPGLHISRGPRADYPPERLRREASVLDGVRLLGDGPLAERLWSRPSASVLAIDAPRVDGASNSLHASARAKVGLRLAPGDNVQAAGGRLTKFLTDSAPWGAHVAVEVAESSEAYEIDASGHWFNVARDAFGTAFGQDMLDIGGGGSIPFVSAFAERFPEAAILVTSAGADADSRVHGTNESLDLADFGRACAAESLLLQLLTR